MSATVSTPVIAVEVAELNLSPKDLEKKVRVPTTLPAKYGKFIQFGYFMMNKLNACDGDEDTPPLIDEQVFLNKLRIFEPLEDQQAFVEEFLESSKQINDELRKMMLQRKREIAKAAKKSGGPKVPPETPSSKNKKSGKTKKTTTDEAVDNTDPTQPVVKKTRAKKVKVTSTEDALVNELVQLAEGSTSESSLSKKESANAAVAKLIAEVPKIADPVKETKAKSGEPTSSSANPSAASAASGCKVEPPSGALTPDLAAPVPSLKEKETKPKAAKEDKPKAAKEDKPKVAKEEKPKVAKEEKPKVAKETKPKAVKETTPVAEEKINDKEEGEEEEEELQVAIFMYEGQQYLIDYLNNVYDFTSHDKIGSLVDQILVKST
jgi:hypothetical protein